MTTSHKQAVNRVINGGLSANMLLALLKTFFGIIGHSSALLADGINSTSDVAYYVVVKICVRFSHRPPDHEHPYGHRQLESIAALTVGAFVITTAIALFWNALDRVFDLYTAVDAVEPIPRVALVVALVMDLAKIGLTIWSRRTAERTGNPAILALARDHRNDVLSASGAAVGILLSRLGWTWGDPVLGGFVALLVLATGIQILREAAGDLMDAVPSREVDVRVRAVLADLSGVLAVEEVQAHRFGPYLVLHVTVGLDGRISVAEGDRIATRVEQRLAEKIDLLQRVYVHCHPARVGWQEEGKRA